MHYAGWCPKHGPRITSQLQRYDECVDCYNDFQGLSTVCTGHGAELALNILKENEKLKDWRLTHIGEVTSLNNECDRLLEENKELKQTIDTISKNM